MEKEYSIPVELAALRLHYDLTQSELGRRAGLPQMHISAIESGKVAPRIDTLRKILQQLDFDLVMVPRELIPVVKSMIRAHQAPPEPSAPSLDEQPLYLPDEDEGDGEGVS